MEKEYRILVVAEQYIDVWAENEDAAQEEVYDRLWEDSSNFLKEAEIESITEIS